MTSWQTFSLSQTPVTCTLSYTDAEIYDGDVSFINEGYKNLVASMAEACQF